jgi:hypothetical protein
MPVVVLGVVRMAEVWVKAAVVVEVVWIVGGTEAVALQEEEGQM